MPAPHPFQSANNTSPFTNYLSASRDPALRNTLEFGQHGGARFNDNFIRGLRELPPEIANNPEQLEQVRAMNSKLLQGTLQRFSPRLRQSILNATRQREQELFNQPQAQAQPQPQVTTPEPEEEYGDSLLNAPLTRGNTLFSLGIGSANTLGLNPLSRNFMHPRSFRSALRAGEHYAQQPFGTRVMHGVLSPVEAAHETGALMSQMQQDFQALNQQNEILAPLSTATGRMNESRVNFMEQRVRPLYTRWVAAGRPATMTDPSNGQTYNNLAPLMQAFEQYNTNRVPTSPGVTPPTVSLRGAYSGSYQRARAVYDRAIQQHQEALRRQHLQDLNTQTIPPWWDVVRGHPIWQQ